jgi:dipeptidyl aminopeptidase/acylaminoacyl peptidase
MKHIAWMTALIAGVTGCSGAIVGGDLGGLAGSAGSSGGSGNLPAAGGTSGGALPENPIGGASGGYTPTSSCSSTIDAWVAFDSDAANFNRDLYAVRPDGSQLTRLTTDPSVDKEPYFSPIGDRLSFTSDRNGLPQIFVMDLASRAVSQVTHRTQGADQSSFSVDGQLLAFHSGASIFTIKPDGSGETLVATGLDNFNAYFSPRFIGNTELVFDRRNEINAIKLEGTDLRNIVHNWTTSIVAPSVSPQGNEIAYAVGCGIGAMVEGLSVWTATASVSTEPCSGRRVTPADDPLTSTRPSWGPANTIAYERVDPATNIGRITLITRATGSIPCSLSAATNDSRNPNWSSEGTEL